MVYVMLGVKGRSKRCQRGTMRDKGGIYSESKRRGGEV